MGVKVSDIARMVGEERTYVSHQMRLLKFHSKVRSSVRQNTLLREHALALLRLKPGQQLELAEEVMGEGLTTPETRKKVRKLLGR